MSYQTIHRYHWSVVTKRKQPPPLVSFIMLRDIGTQDDVLRGPSTTGTKEWNYRTPDRVNGSRRLRSTIE